MSAPEDPTSAADGHAANAPVFVPNNHMDTSASPAKRKVEIPEDENNVESKRRRGTAPIKAEYLLASDHRQDHVLEVPVQEGADDDAAEAFHHKDRSIATGNSKHKRREKNQGQNKARKFGNSREEVQLCSTRTRHNEFSPKQCPFGEKCRFEHDIRNYLKHKRGDLSTFNAVCPVFEVKGKCPVGWKCRFVGSHSKEIEHEDGRKELVLLGEDGADSQALEKASGDDVETGVANALSADQRISLTKKNFPTPKSEAYLQYVNTLRDPERSNGPSRPQRNSSSPEPENAALDEQAAKQDNAAGYVEPPFRPSEKRRLYFGPETPILAPLTTQGNLPFRRLCTSLGATFTYSEMAMSMPLLQGQKSEWALLKAHESEVQPPTFSTKNIVYDYGYDQSQDMHFGAQIAANKPWLACKATEILTTLLPRGLRCVDLNVGCPIDLVYREGAGSALMDSSHKLEKMLRGMNYVSNSTPVTVKIRTGTKDKSPTAQKLVERLVLGGGASSRSTLSPTDPQAAPCGVAAITLHGRSRQQRYTRSADWEYISSTASLISNLNTKRATLQDTIYEPDARDLPNTSPSRDGKVFFIGNGDVFSPEHYTSHLRDAHVDGVMVARGALIKPWLFEEITSNQHLDKSSSERLRYIEAFCRYGLEAWGSDEVGVGQTRRFLLEWLSFACRYVPVGLLEVLPPNIQDRPPRYRGRNELETLMASDNYLDWIKISEMFLGKAAEGFRFEPKHRSNAYDTQAEG